MEMQGSRVLSVTQQQAWEALNNPDVLKVCIPGCDKIELTGENQYAIGMSVKLGPVAAKFSGKLLLSDINPPHSYALQFDGQGGAAGFGKGSSQVRLVPQDSGCELVYSVQATVGGKIAQLGQRLIDGAAKSMAEDFFKRFDNEMQRLYPAVEAGAADAVAPAVADQAPSAGPAVPAWLWVAGAAVVLGVGLWVMRSFG
jgi:uncharacterized protein